MIEAHEIRQQLSLLAEGRVSLNELEAWFMSKTWNMHRDGSPEAIDLAESIHLLFSERDDLILSEVDLRDELLALTASTYRIPVVRWDVALTPKNEYASLNMATQVNRPSFARPLHSSLAHAYVQL